MGIEPTYPAWKAGVLPLNYTRRFVLFFVSLEDVIYNTSNCFNCQHFFEKFFIFFTGAVLGHPADAGTIFLSGNYRYIFLFLLAICRDFLVLSDFL